MADKAQILQEYAEKWKQAVELEQHTRDAAFLSDTEFIGNIEVWSLTPKLFTQLTLMQSPLVTSGKDITPESMLTFLWVIKKIKTNISPDEFFNSTIQNEDFEKITKQICDYFERSFQDVPKVGKSQSSVPYFSSLAVIVDRLASEYGWSEEAIINIPYKRLFQYMRLQEKKNNPKAILTNQSDSVKSEMIQKLNEKVD